MVCEGREKVLLEEWFGIKPEPSIGAVAPTQAEKTEPQATVFKTGEETWTVEISMTFD